MANKVTGMALVCIISVATAATACDPYKPKPTPSPPKVPPTYLYCPMKTPRFGVCGDLLSSLLNLVVGTPSSSECCSLLHGLGELEAASCLCSAFKANLLGVIKLDWSYCMGLLFSSCGKSIPSSFQCA